MENNIWPSDRVLMTGGESISFACVFPGVTVSSPSMKVFANKTNVTSTLCPAGSMSVSGNIVTTKPIVIPENPAPRYVVEITATVDGNTEVRPFMIYTRANGEEQ